MIFLRWPGADHQRAGYRDDRALLVARRELLVDAVRDERREHLVLLDDAAEEVEKVQLARRDVEAAALGLGLDVLQ